MVPQKLLHHYLHSNCTPSPASHQLYIGECVCVLGINVFTHLCFPESKICNSCCLTVAKDICKYMSERYIMETTALIPYAWLILSCFFMWFYMYVLSIWYHLRTSCWINLQSFKQLFHSGTNKLTIKLLKVSGGFIVATSNLSLKFQETLLCMCQ